MTVNELQKQLTGLGTFERKSDDQLRNLAESMYQPQYQQDVQSLRDSLNQQLAQQNRSAINSGMQRSSYNQAAQASIQAGGLRSQADLAASYEGNVAAMLAQLMQNEDSRQDTYNSNRDTLLLNLYKATKSSGSTSGDDNPLNVKDPKDNNNVDNDLESLLGGTIAKTKKPDLSSVSSASELAKSLKKTTSMPGATNTIVPTKTTTFTKASNVVRKS